jgi:hypothetical protein
MYIEDKIMLRNDLTPEQMRELAKAGASLSRQLTMPFTGEKAGASLNLDKFGGVEMHLVVIATGTDLLDYCNNGGLNHIYFTRDDQNTWNEKRWLKEIKKRIP